MKLASLTLAAVVATAGVVHAQSMGEGYDMLTSSLMNDFEVIGVSMDSLDGLTLLQIAEIRAVLEDDEQSTAQKRNRVENIISGN